MVETGMRGGICHSICRYAKADNKYMEDYDKNKELPYPNLMSQKLPLNHFEWIKNTLQFNKDFIKTIMKKVGEG